MLYIKFKEGSIRSLKIACREAERLGYKILKSKTALWLVWYSLLRLIDLEYYTSHYSEKENIEQWYKHHKINPLRKLYYYLTT